MNDKIHPVIRESFRNFSVFGNEQGEQLEQVKCHVDVTNASRNNWVVVVHSPETRVVEREIE